MGASVKGYSIVSEETPLGKGSAGDAKVGEKNWDHKGKEVRVWCIGGTKRKIQKLPKGGGQILKRYLWSPLGGGGLRRSDTLKEK